MTDLTNKNWMDIGETDDPNAIIESFEAEAAVAKGDPVYLSSDHKGIPSSSRSRLHRDSSQNRLSYRSMPSFNPRQSQSESRRRHNTGQSSLWS
jgi:hypothetical protein